MTENHQISSRTGMCPVYAYVCTSVHTCAAGSCNSRSTTASPPQPHICVSSRPSTRRNGERISSPKITQPTNVCAHKHALYTPNANSSGLHSLSTLQIYSEMCLINCNLFLITRPCAMKVHPHIQIHYTHIHTIHTYPQRFGCADNVGRAWAVLDEKAILSVFVRWLLTSFAWCIGNYICYTYLYSI